MATARDLADALDAFMAAQKSILGANQHYEWGPGYSQWERKAKFPLEVGGESPEQARLEVIGFPQSSGLKFRLSICWNAAICRLDYTDETHPNTMRIDADQIPPWVDGPHYHSWPLNRRFFKGASTAPKLHNAEPFTMRASFDSILRWFCQQANVDQPNGGHLIDLPPRGQLL